MKPKVIDLNFSMPNFTLPVRLYLESRQTVRASVGRQHAILRMPYRLTANEQSTYLEWFKEWLLKEFQTNATSFARWQVKTYENNSQIFLFDRIYTIFLTENESKSSSGKMNKKREIHLNLPPDLAPLQRQKAIKTLLSRLIAKDCQPDFERRVDVLNDQFFQEDINQIRLKLSHSNWGSCSSNRNLNFSTRLLFAPSEVIDYVIIHELAHLKELNHSERFWQIVATAMPNYSEKERWLKDNGHLCHF